MSTIRIKMNNYEDRKSFMLSLLNNGHKVWVEMKEKRPNPYQDEYDYIVCFEIKQEIPKDMEIGK